MERILRDIASELKRIRKALEYIAINVVTVKEDDEEDDRK